MAIQNGHLTRADLQFALDGAVHTILTEMVRLGEANERLGGIDATLIHHGKQLVAAVRAIAGFNE